VQGGCIGNQVQETEEEVQEKLRRRHHPVRAADVQRQLHPWSWHCLVRDEYGVGELVRQRRGQ